jgi:hypothetical protein
MPIMMMAAVYQRIANMMKKREFLDMVFSGCSSVGFWIWGSEFILFNGEMLGI